MSSLDALFPRGLSGVRLLKLDVQGFECEVLQGGFTALASSASQRVEVIAAEVSSTHLRAQCCKPSWLNHLLRAGGGARLDEYGFLSSEGLQHGPWNVSCLQLFRDEETCIARPFDFQNGRQRQQQFAMERVPTDGVWPKWRLEQTKVWMNTCQGRERWKLKRFKRSVLDKRSRGCARAGCTS